MAEDNKISLLRIFLEYLTNTRPVLLFVHLVWIMMVSLMLSGSYILAFNFTKLVDLYQEAHSIKNFSNNLKISAQQDIEINELLKTLMDSTKSSRSYIFRYHNGLASVSGVPFFFETNTHEMISPGTSRIMQFNQRLPTNFNFTMNEKFARDECIALRNLDRDSNNQYYYLFQNRGSKSTVRCPIFLNNGDLFGYVGIDFTKDVSNEIWNQSVDLVKKTSVQLTRIYTKKA